MKPAKKTRPTSALIAGLVFLFACMALVQIWEVEPKVDLETAQIEP